MPRIKRRLSILEVSRQRGLQKEVASDIEKGMAEVRSIVDPSI